MRKGLLDHTPARKAVIVTKGDGELAEVTANCLLASTSEMLSDCFGTGYLLSGNRQNLGE
jgi:hypothetical protein